MIQGNVFVSRMSSCIFFKVKFRDPAWSRCVSHGGLAQPFAYVYCFISGHVCFFVRPSEPQISVAPERIFTDSTAS